MISDYCISQWNSWGNLWYVDQFENVAPVINIPMAMMMKIVVKIEIVDQINSLIELYGDGDDGNDDEFCQTTSCVLPTATS